MKRGWQADGSALTPLDVVLTFVIVGAVFGVCFFTSPPPGMTPDGALPWARGALLKALTDALAFDFKVATPQGFEIKNLVAGLAAGLAVIVVAVGLFARGRSVEQRVALEEPSPAATVPGALRRQIDPLFAAQLMIIAFVGLSFASAAWAPIPELAMGGSLLLLGYVLWALAIRYGLSAPACRAAGTGIVAVLVAAALLALWYFYERNPSMRVGYPIGNPLFFAASLIPAILLSTGAIISSLAAVRRGQHRAWWTAFVYAVALVPLGWAMAKADPRSSYLGLAVGMAALAFLGVRGKRSKVTVAACTILLGAAVSVWWLGPKIAGRSETVRTRLYAWRYARDLIAEAPVLGCGQGGFALRGDALAVQDVADDPRALHARLAHVHNEWLETWVDLGSVGLVVILSAYLLTLLAGIRALRQIADPRRRWLLASLLATLVALVAEECLDVALRVAGLPILFFAVLGMSWALIADCGTMPSPGTRRRAAGIPGLAVIGAVLVGLVVCAAAVLDFQAARALFTFREKLDRRQWEPAIADAQLAARFRLSPNRRLGALSSRAWCHARIAEAFLQDAMAKLVETEQVSADRQRLMLSAQTYAGRAAEESAQALQQLDAVTRHSGPAIGLYGVVAGCHRILHLIAMQAGQAEEARRQLTLAADALATALQREPYNEGLVWMSMELSPDLPLADRLELMCGPMRYHEVEQRYFELILDLARDEAFDVEFAPLLAAALQELERPPTDGPALRCGAQILRVGSWVAAGRSQFERARALAGGALSLAEREKKRLPIAFAVAHRELAHYTFLADPEAVEQAVEILQTGRAVLPDSHESARARARFDQRLAQYYLALGEEEAARALIPAVAQLKPEAVNFELGMLYYSLCQLILTFSPEKRPSYFPDVVDRVYALSQTVSFPPAIHAGMVLLKAQQEYAAGDIAATIDLWREALFSGTDAQALLGVVQRVAGERPDDRRLQDFLAELRAQLMGPPAEDRP